MRGATTDDDEGVLWMEPSRTEGEEEVVGIKAGEKSTKERGAVSSVKNLVSIPAEMSFDSTDRSQRRYLDSSPLKGDIPAEDKAERRVEEFMTRPITC